MFGDRKPSRKVQKWVDSSKKDENKGRYVQNIFNLYIEPELARRKQSGKKIISTPQIILIMFPAGKEPIIQFDKEIVAEALARSSPRKHFDKINEPVHLYDLQEVIKVQPPKFEGQDVPFLYLQNIGNTWLIIGNSEPAKTAEKFNLDNGTETTLEELFTGIYQLTFEERVIKFYEAYSGLLESVGFWAIPSLIPYPLNTVIEYISKGDNIHAMEILMDHCSNGFLEKITTMWWDVIPFADRKSHFLDGLNVHS